MYPKLIFIMLDVHFSQDILDYDIESVNDEKLGCRAIVIRKFLSNAECSQLVASIESLNLIPGSSQLEFRDNFVLEVPSTRIADQIERRMRPLLGLANVDTVCCGDHNAHEFLDNGIGMKGEWKFHHIHSVLEVVKYNEVRYIVCSNSTNIPYTTQTGWSLQVSF